MRRDMEYVRLMLIDLSNGKFNRKIPHTDRMPASHEREEYEKYMYHLTLLKDGGFISYKMDGTFDGNLLYACPQLTWEGNDFLDAIENDTVWNKTKGIAKEKGLEIAKISFDVVKNLAIQQSKKMLGIE
ncbi:DUF2513 domain-containing protein [Lysinibacillus sp. M3]|uniref:DUF2513 domain-containing protein n=1 Tax=Lysinibacillus zambalensis TaxID=3160866 RepID=A0ABV1MN37_9BACI